jgi:alkylmercury lyase
MDQPLSARGGADRVAMLAERFLAVFPSLNSEQRRLAVLLYRLLAEGEPVSPGRLAEAARTSLSSVEAALSGWSGLFYEQGAIIGFWGLSPRPVSKHVLSVEGRTLYAWCAWDALFLPEILGATARVSSVDPESGVEIGLTVSPEAVLESKPKGAAMSILDEPNDQMMADVVTQLCHFIHFFASRETAASWSFRHPGTSVLSLEEGFRLGRLMNRGMFGEALEPPGLARPRPARGAKP